MRGDKRVHVAEHRLDHLIHGVGIDPSWVTRMLRIATVGVSLVWPE